MGIWIEVGFPSPFRVLRSYSHITLGCQTGILGLLAAIYQVVEWHVNGKRRTTSLPDVVSDCHYCGHGMKFISLLLSKLNWRRRKWIALLINVGRFWKASSPSIMSRFFLGKLDLQFAYLVFVNNIVLLVIARVSYLKLLFRKIEKVEDTIIIH